MKNIFYTLVIVATLSSCSEDITTTGFNAIQNTEGITSFEDYFDFINNETKYKVLIQNTSDLYSNNISAISCGIKEGSIKDFIFNFDNQSFVSNTIIGDDSDSGWVLFNQSTHHVYGKKMEATIDNNEASLISSSEGFYIPELLNVSISGLVNDMVVSGTTITWNKDVNNKRGIVVAAEYSPYKQTQQTIAEEYTEIIVRGSTIADTGSYTITEADLSHFPNISNLTFFIGRAGFVIALDDNDPTNDVSLGAYTAVRADFEIKQ